MLLGSLRVSQCHAGQAIAAGFVISSRLQQEGNSTAIWHRFTVQVTLVGQVSGYCCGIACEQVPWCCCDMQEIVCNTSKTSKLCYLAPVAPGLEPVTDDLLCAGIVGLGGRDRIPADDNIHRVHVCFSV